MEPPEEPPSPETAEVRPGKFRVPAVIGVILLGMLTAGGVVQQRMNARAAEESRAVRALADAGGLALADYRMRFQNLQGYAAGVRAWAEEQKTEPLRSWARERVPAGCPTMPRSQAPRTLSWASRTRFAPSKGRRPPTTGASAGILCSWSLL